MYKIIHGLIFNEYKFGLNIKILKYQRNSEKEFYLRINPSDSIIYWGKFT